MITIITLDVTLDPKTGKVSVDNVALGESKVPSLIIWQLVGAPDDAQFKHHSWNRQNMKPEKGIFGRFRVAPGGKWACMTDHHRQPNPKKSGCTCGTWSYSLEVKHRRRTYRTGRPRGGNDPNIKNR